MNLIRRYQWSAIVPRKTTIGIRTTSESGEKPTNATMYNTAYIQTVAAELGRLILNTESMFSLSTVIQT